MKITKALGDLVRVKLKSHKKVNEMDKEIHMDADSLSKVGQSWEALAKSDPMWAILSDPAKKGNKWDIEEFFLTGKIEIDPLVHYIESSFPLSGKSSALDFGCGMGRLSLALAQYYDRVFGIDISDTMIESARKYNRYGEKITYVVNKSNSLPFEDNTFDLIYSNIVLQHMNKYNALFYITEFVRAIRKDGLIVFQAPSRSLADKGIKFASPVETLDGVVTIDMNMIPLRFVIDTVYDAGGKVLEIKSDKSAGPKFESFKYFISK